MRQIKQDLLFNLHFFVNSVHNLTFLNLIYKKKKRTGIFTKDILLGHFESPHIVRFTIAQS
jgi:hypothetical protein